MLHVFDLYSSTNTSPRFTKEKADSTNSSYLDLNSRRNSVTVYSGRDEPLSPTRFILSPDGNARDSGTTANGFDSPASKPRLVGLSQPFFATSPPLETPKQQLAAVERVTAEAARRGDKVRVLVAEDNIGKAENTLFSA